MIPYPRSFYMQETWRVAQQLLGSIIVIEHDYYQLIGKIVETEAYGDPSDMASHAYPKISQRNQIMYGPVGMSYVYMIYGMHWCFNIIARHKNTLAGGVLIRAIEPLEGKDYMHLLRPSVQNYHLTNGPGKLTQALGISDTYHNIDLTKPEKIYVCPFIQVPEKDVIRSTRIGIARDKERPWRFFLDKNPWVSGKNPWAKGKITHI